MKSEKKKLLLDRVRPLLKDGRIPSQRITEALEILISSRDRVFLEGDNQKQATFLSGALAGLDVNTVSQLHMIIPSVSRQEHLDIFEKGIAEKLDFSYSGTQGARIAQMLEAGTLKIDSIHTYLELYGRLFIDLIPNVALVAADKADADGNLYTGPNTEETPTVIEATAFKDGIVIAQVNELVDELPRVDIPGSWVDFVVAADRPYELEPLFTKDPAYISETDILMAMMTIRGIYERHKVQSLNHGVGFHTAAIELLLPTYGASLGLKGKVCKNWVLNPHPTMIPAIESGWVDSIHCFGGEIGMEAYAAARPDVFFTGKDGSLRSNRAMAQVAGQYAVDLFIGSTLQIDRDGNSSTVTEGRLTGFGGAPNMGSDARGRRHMSETWLDLAAESGPIRRGKKLVVQIVKTRKKAGPVFVESLDAVQVGRKANLPAAPIMVYGDDITHIVTEEGIAYLYKAQSLDERRAAVAAIAGDTPLGQGCSARTAAKLRQEGIVMFPEDLKINKKDAKRSLLAAESIDDLVKWSDGLYHPPKQFLVCHSRGEESHKKEEIKCQTKKIRKS
jgi:malonate decarboxylase alpha subunit